MSRKPIVLDDGAEKTLQIKGYNKRLKIIMTLLTLAGVFITSLYFYNIWAKENKALESRLETFTELRHSTLSRFVNSLAQETELWASQDSVRNEASQYFEIWNTLSSSQRAVLRGKYIEDKASVSALNAYQITHEKYHKNRQAFMHHHGYYDVFYFNLAGDLVYTVEKEVDFGLNFDVGGEYAKSGLGQVFRRARDSDSGASVFYDFAPYAPSNNAPASFLASPMFDKSGKKIGVYAIQISIKEFDAVLNYSSGLGETGETYVVGQDLLMRNNSRLSKKPSLLVHTVDTPAVRAALAGDSVTVKGRNYTGDKTLIVAMPLRFSGTHWAVLAEMELSELRAPLKPYFWFYLIALSFIFVFGAVQYWMLLKKPS